MTNDPTDVCVRSEREEDHDAIRRVHEAAFPTSTEASLVDALRDAGRLVVSRVAERNAAVVGHVAFSPVSLAGAPELRGLGLGPVAVLPAHQRDGIGAALCETGLLACQRMNIDFVVVLGDPRYYHRFGFTTASDMRLKNEYRVDDEFMVRVLSIARLPKSGGLVRYAPEFGDLE